jgi:hypothetical protein
MDFLPRERMGLDHTCTNRIDIGGPLDLLRQPILCRPQLPVTGSGRGDQRTADRSWRACNVALVRPLFQTREHLGSIPSPLPGKIGNACFDIAVCLFQKPRQGLFIGELR